MKRLVSCAFPSLHAHALHRERVQLESTSLMMSFYALSLCAITPTLLLVAALVLKDSSCTNRNLPWALSVSSFSSPAVRDWSLQVIVPSYGRAYNNNERSVTRGQISFCHPHPRQLNVSQKRRQTTCPFSSEIFESSSSQVIRCSSSWS